MEFNGLDSKTVINCTELKLVGFRVLCAGEQYIVEIPLAVRKLDERVNEIKHVADSTVQIGAFVVDTEKEEEDGYWICVEVNEYENIPEGMETLSIPSQNYALWNYKGANLEITGAYEELHHWIAGKNYKRLTGKWHLEIFYSWRDTDNIDVTLLDTVE